MKRTEPLAEAPAKVETMPSVTYPMPEAPEFGLPVPVAPHVYWLRMPLPFALNHINIWLIDQEDGWSLVDTGVATEKCKAIWNRLLSEGLDGKSLKRIVCTHFHPDHVGLGGWLVSRTEADFWMTGEEWLMARVISSDHSPETEDSYGAFFDLVGLDGNEDASHQFSFAGYRSITTPIPRIFRRMENGQTILLGNLSWRVIIGRGHSPEHACLYSKDAGILIAGDLVLPNISTNISVHAMEPYADPLRQYLEILAELRKLPADTLVLPSHGLPFQGLRLRVDALISHHDACLADLAKHLPAQVSIGDAIEILFPRELNPFEQRMAAGEALAHLNRLVEQGAAVRTENPAKKWLFEPA